MKNTLILLFFSIAIVVATANTGSIYAQNQTQNQTSASNPQNDTMATITDKPNTIIANQTTIPAEQTTVTVNQTTNSIDQISTSTTRESDINSSNWKLIKLRK